MLKLTDHLLEISNEHPTYLAQKGLYLELKRDSARAREYYNKSLLKYQSYLKDDSLNFNLMIEYITMLDFSGDTTSANQTLRKLKGMNLDETQNQIIDLYRHSSIEQIKQYWKGEISYDEINKYEDYKQRSQ